MRYTTYVLRPTVPIILILEEITLRSSKQGQTGHTPVPKPMYVNGLIKHADQGRGPTVRRRIQAHTIMWCRACSSLICRDQPTALNSIYAGTSDRTE